MSATIRPAREGDVQAVAELIEEIELFYGSAVVQPLAERESQVRQALFGSPPLASALVAEDEAGDVAGIAAYSFLWPAAGTSHSLYLKELYVRSTLRRQGVGARMMRELEAIAAARPGCSRIEWTGDRDNPGALRFYRSLGFSQSEGKILYRAGTGGTA